MTALDSLKRAIEELPPDDIEKLRLWLLSRSMDDWDNQMAQDLAPGGRARWLAEEAERDIAEGQDEDLLDGFRRRELGQAS
ncbi:MAG: hypothetical protein H6509_06780 [Bryobacterales bacterium]|nr:hypothetical protein [Bryobacterales bacterium]